MIGLLLSETRIVEQKEIVTEDKVVKVEKSSVPLNYISPELAESMKTLWGHAAFREAYQAAAREGSYMSPARLFE